MSSGLRRLWRISNYADLSGLGGLRFAGRWHNHGRAIVYCAEHPAAALAEMLVHLDREDMPASFQLLTLDIPADLAVERVDVSSLSANWTQSLVEPRITGDEWLKSLRTPLLEVPSALVPDAWNVLLNPAHPRAGEVKILQSQHVPLDSRFG